MTKTEEQTSCLVSNLGSNDNNGAATPSGGTKLGVFSFNSFGLREWSTMASTTKVIKAISRDQVCPHSNKLKFFKNSIL